jgi:hypothetical protein
MTLGSRGSMLLVSVAAAVVAELLLAAAWWRFASDPSAKGLAMMLWIWPVSWAVVTVFALLLGMLGDRYDDDPFTVSWRASMFDLFSRVLLLGVPIVVCGYGAIMAVVAWTTSRS